MRSTAVGDVAAVSRGRSQPPREPDAGIAKETLGASELANKNALTRNNSRPDYELTSWLNYVF